MRTTFITMNTLSTKPALPSADIDMHIGLMFDTERYLELERQLFKVEPRPIPGSGRSVAQPPAKKTILGDFIDAATKFSCWLDDVLKAPFRALHRQTASASTGEAANAGARMPSANLNRDDTPSPKVDQMNRMDLRRYSHRQVSVKTLENEAPQQSLRGKLPGVKKGHVKNLIQKYEDWSDITSEGSVEQSIKKSLTSKPPRNENDHSGITESFSGGTQGRVEANHPTLQKKVTQGVVPKPAKVAASPSIMVKKNANRRGGKSDGCVTSRDEEAVPYVGDTNSRLSGGNGGRRNVGTGGRGRRAAWAKFCGMRRGGNGRA